MLHSPDKTKSSHRIKLPFQKTLMKIFISSLRCTPYVFKEATTKFLSIWLPFVILIFVYVGKKGGGDGSGDLTANYLKTQIGFMLPLFEHCFTYFIIPYLVFKFINMQSNTSTKKFWDFVSENVFPLVINQIKSNVIIFLYMFLLIVPGIVKAVRFLLITPATFFGKDYIGGSALKLSDELTRGFFWGTCIILLISFSLPFTGTLAGTLLTALVGQPQGTLDFTLMETTKYLIKFYAGCFGIILITQTFFTLKTVKSL